MIIISQIENNLLLVWQMPEVKELSLHVTFGGDTNNSENDTGMWS